MIIIEAKTRLKGTRKIKFEKLVKEREETVSSILREMIDFYFENQLIISKKRDSI